MRISKRRGDATMGTNNDAEHMVVSYLQSEMEILLDLLGQHSRNGRPNRNWSSSNKEIRDSWYFLKREAREFDVVSKSHLSGIKGHVSLLQKMVPKAWRNRKHSNHAIYEALDEVSEAVEELWDDVT